MSLQFVLSPANDQGRHELLVRDSRDKRDKTLLSFPLDAFGDRPAPWANGREGEGLLATSPVSIRCPISAGRLPVGLIQTLLAACQLNLLGGGLWGDSLLGPIHQPASVLEAWQPRRLGRDGLGHVC